MSGASEEFEWASVAGSVELSDGETVFVRGGDILLGEETSAGILFHQHLPATRH